MNGEFERPTPRVLSDRDVVPGASLVRPPPNRFSHETVASTAFSYDVPLGDEPDGTFPGGTPVLLVRDEDGRSRVIDGQGLYVVVERASLRPLAGQDPT